MSKQAEKLEKSVKLATATLFELEDAEISCIAISSKELFGKADTVLVSKDKKVWISHSYDEFMDAVNNKKPLRVGF